MQDCNRRKKGAHGGAPFPCDFRSFNLGWRALRWLHAGSRRRLQQPERPDRHGPRHSSPPRAPAGPLPSPASPLRTAPACPPRSSPVRTGFATTGCRPIVRTGPADRSPTGPARWSSGSRRSTPGHLPTMRNCRRPAIRYPKKTRSKLPVAPSLDCCPDCAKSELSDDCVPVSEPLPDCCEDESELPPDDCATLSAFSCWLSEPLSEEDAC